MPLPASFEPCVRQRQLARPSVLIEDIVGQAFTHCRSRVWPTLIRHTVADSESPAGRVGAFTGYAAPGIRRHLRRARSEKLAWRSNRRREDAGEPTWTRQAVQRVKDRIPPPVANPGEPPDPRAQPPSRIARVRRQRTRATPGTSEAEKCRSAHERPRFSARCMALAKWNKMTQ